MELRSYHTESCSHSHDFAQWVLPLSGSMELEAGYYSGVVDNHVGVFIAPNERHCFAGSRENLFLVIDVPTQNHLLEERGSHAFDLTANIKKLIYFTHHYLADHEGDIFADSLINQLLIHFATKSCSPELDHVAIKAKNWIDLNFANPVDVSNVAQYCYLSVSQLQRRFKLALGCSMGEYWRFKKLHHAQKLLSSKDCSIEAIALAVGYENVSAFSRRFSNVFGDSPSQWRIKALSAHKMREMDNSN
ncbi:helix-turn-helix domain-containing protein [Legionella sp. WA2022007384]